MATKAFKSDKIDALKAKIEKAQVAILADYKGLSVEEITKVRRALQKDGGDFMVIKNTLAKIAVKGTPFEVLTDSFKGPMALAFGFEDQVSPAKASSKFIRRQSVVSQRSKCTCISSFKRRTLCKNAWLHQFTCFRCCWIYQRSYGTAYTCYGSC